MRRSTSRKAKKGEIADALWPTLWNAAVPILYVIGAVLKEAAASLIPVIARAAEASKAGRQVQLSRSEAVAPEVEAGPWLVRPFGYVSRLLDLDDLIRRYNPLLHGFLLPWAGAISPQKDTGVVLLLGATFMLLLDRYFPDQAVLAATYFLFSFLYASCRNLIHAHEGFVIEDDDLRAQVDYYDKSLSPNKAPPKLSQAAATMRRNRRLAKLWDTQDLLGTYMLVSPLQLWSDYYYDLSRSARAWQIVLLPVTTTMLFYGKTITGNLISSLNIPDLVDPAQSPAEYENEYMQWLMLRVLQLKDSVPFLSAYIAVTSRLTLLSGVTVIVVTAAVIVTLLCVFPTLPSFLTNTRSHSFSALPTTHVAYLLGWTLLMLKSLYVVAVPPPAFVDSLHAQAILQDSSNYMESALTACNLLCAWALLNVAGSIEGIGLVTKALERYVPAYLIYKTTTLASLASWYGMDAVVAVGPLARDRGRGLAHRVFLLFNKLDMKETQGGIESSPEAVPETVEPSKDRKEWLADRAAGKQAASVTRHSKPASETKVSGRK